MQIASPREIKYLIAKARRTRRYIGKLRQSPQNLASDFGECGLINRDPDKMDTHANAKGQILIPAEIREKYGIRRGTRIVVSDFGNTIRLQPITEQYLKKLQGSLRGKGALTALMNERRNKQK